MIVITLINQLFPAPSTPPAPSKHVCSRTGIARLYTRPLRRPARKVDVSNHHKLIIFCIFKHNNIVPKIFRAVGDKYTAGTYFPIFPLSHSYRL